MAYIKNVVCEMFSPEMQMLASTATKRPAFYFDCTVFSLARVVVMMQRKTCL